MLHSRPRFPQLVAAAVAVVTTVACALTAGPATAATVTPHLNPSDLSSAWMFPAKNWSSANKEAGRVDDVLRIGNRVYIAGNFTITESHSGATQTRTYLAAEDATTGALLGWAPKLNGRAYVLAASPNHQTLFVGGSFTSVDGTPRSHLASFNIATGALTSAVPSGLAINGAVRAISRSGTTMYIGGDFTSVAGHAHHYLARLNLVGSSHFVTSTWSPSADNSVRDLIADGPRHRVLVAGWFGRIDGVKGQCHLASVSTITGRPLPWTNHPPDPILDIARTGSRLYAAETGPGGVALAYNAVTGKRAWFYMADGNMQAVTTANGWPVFGMHGSYVAPHANLLMREYSDSTRIKRTKLFELSPDGVLQAWKPNIGSTQGVLGVWALKASQGMLYVGGDFTLVNGKQQQRFAMFPQIRG
jgi:hypothetical protein